MTMPSWKADPGERCIAHITIKAVFERLFSYMPFLVRQVFPREGNFVILFYDPILMTGINDADKTGNTIKPSLQLSIINNQGLSRENNHGQI